MLLKDKIMPLVGDIVIRMEHEVEGLTGPGDV